ATGKFASFPYGSHIELKKITVYNEGIKAIPSKIMIIFFFVNIDCHSCLIKVAHVHSYSFSLEVTIDSQSITFTSLVPAINNDSSVYFCNRCLNNCSASENTSNTSLFLFLILSACKNTFSARFVGRTKLS